MLLRKLPALCFFLFCSTTLLAQLTIDVNLDMRHSVNGVDSFEREKYIVIHENLYSSDWNSDQEKADFLNEYDVYLGRDNGLIPWLYNQSWEDPNRPGFPDTVRIEEGGSSSRNRHANSAINQSIEYRTRSNMMGGQLFASQFNGPTNPNACCGPPTGWSYANGKADGEFIGHLLKSYFGDGGASGQPRPTMFEVLNEPFVAANNYGTNNQEITQYHKDVAAEVRRINPDVLIGGYSAAFPQFEAGDFGLWNNTWKYFIDHAGGEMDYFSVHLYDYGPPESPESPTYRVGSNIEAILDMIEQYSTHALGEVKPFNISEYGYWSPGFTGVPYTKEREWHYIRSLNSITLQFMQRPDRMLKVVPFLLTKASWFSHPSGHRYPHRLYRQQFELAGETGNEWVFTEQVQFYELWKNVRGKRLETYSPDPDIQVDAYVDSNTVYLLVNNLEFEAKTIDFNLLHWQQMSPRAAIIKHSYRDESDQPVIDRIEQSTVPDRFELGAEGTVLLELTYPFEIPLTSVAEEQKYYADRMLQPIVANQSRTFRIDGIDLGGFGEASLRVGIGRNLQQSRRPTVTVNGTEISVPDDYRGYDQANRDRFFGLLEIPVPYELLQENNEIGIRFSDGGGHVSSVGMQTWTFSREVNRNNPVRSVQQPLPEGSISIAPNPFHQDFKVSLSDEISEARVELLSVDGKILREWSGVGRELRVSGSGLPGGTYLLRVRSDEGAGVYRVQLVR